MPRFPQYADRVNYITGSVFEKFAPKMREQGANLVQLHIGDSYAPPPYRLPIDPSFIQSHPGFNRYCDTFGILPLREAIVDKLRADNDLAVDPSQIMLTTGASNALNVCMQTLIDPGEEVLVLSPYWPFFRGMVLVAGGKPVEAPTYMKLYDDPDLDLAGYLEPYVTNKTAVLYVNTPNNPTGKVLTKRHLEQLAAFSTKHNLWVVCDEAYDGMTFDGHRHMSLATVDGMFERTVSVFSFSKVYMFAGLRLGYVVAPTDIVRNLNKTMVHQLYGPSTLSQQMMVSAVQTRAEWSPPYIKHVESLRDTVSNELEIQPQAPEGSYYFFFPVDQYLNGRDYWDVIDACLDGGVSVAPGGDFGADFANFIRICFAAESPDRLKIGIERLNKILVAG